MGLASKRRSLDNNWSASTALLRGRVDYLSIKSVTIFLTKDKDFGGLFFVKRLGSGVIYLRTLLLNIDSTHQELERILNSFSEDELKQAFGVVEPGRNRFRKLPQ